MKSKDADLLAEAYGKTMSMGNDQEMLLKRLEAKGESSSADPAKQTINNIAENCHTLLTGGGAGSEYSGIKLNPRQRQVIEQIGRLVLSI